MLLELSIVGQQLSHEVKRLGEKLPENEWGKPFFVSNVLTILNNTSAQATLRLGDCQLLLEKLRVEHLVGFD